MKNSVAVAILMGACAVFAGQGYAQDPVKVAPKMNKVVLENERVRVLDVTVKAGEQMPMHQHPDNIVYVIKGGKTERSICQERQSIACSKKANVRFAKPTRTRSRTRTRPTST